jgi:aryl-alcohol dehydrogenase-like predicted oxidoreductase
MGNDISVSRMTLGTVQLGLNYGIANSEGKPDEGKAFRIIDAALAAGVNCLDTAAAYGDSEKVIGNYLTARNKRRSEVVVATKFKLGNINLADVEYEMMRSVESSLKSLDTDYLDILLMHDAKEYSLFGKRITKVFESLLNKGTIKAAGASCYEFGDIEGMLENDTYHAFQIPVNILDMRFTKSEVADKLSDKLVFARSIFLQGLFFMDPSRLKGNLKEIAGYLTILNEIALEFNISVAQLALSFVNSLRFIDSLVIGAENPEQVVMNARMVDSRSFNKDVVKSLNERLTGAPEWLFKPTNWDKQY